MESKIKRVHYDTDYFDSLDQQNEAMIQRKILHLLEMMREAMPSGIVLDAGCGAGHGLALFQEHAERVVGLDRFGKVAAMAAQRASGAAVCVGDLNSGLPFSDASFDFVFSYEVIEHLTQPEMFLAEAFRVLRPDGCVLLKTPNAWDAWRLVCRVTGRTWYADEDKTHVRYYSVFPLTSLLKKAGFSQVKVFAGTKPFLQRRVAGALNVCIPRIPIFGNGIAALARKM